VSISCCTRLAQTRLWRVHDGSAEQRTARPNGCYSCCMLVLTCPVCLTLLQDGTWAGYMEVIGASHALAANLTSEYVADGCTLLPAFRRLVCSAADVCLSCLLYCCTVLNSTLRCTPHCTPQHLQLISPCSHSAAALLSHLCALPLLTALCPVLPSSLPLTFVH
jgi:hypothetical protein